jgi:tetratricopeptide (TPR) repeat protein
MAAAAEAARRTTYLEAVALYERGLQALQQRRYAEAAGVLRSVLTQYPDEKELHERVRLYLKVCERQTVPEPPAPKTAEERVYAATVAINSGAYDEGVRQLEAVERAEPDNDHAHYMLAVAHSLRGDRGRALHHLQRAVALNAENRELARRDADLETLREADGFREALATPSQGRRDRRPAPRLRGASR